MTVKGKCAKTFGVLNITVFVGLAEYDRRIHLVTLSLGTNKWAVGSNH